MKQMLSRILAFLCYHVGIDMMFYWLNRKAKRIITFHNVLPDELFVGNLANGVSCSASDFSRVIEEIGKRFPFSTDLYDPKSVTLTFDDGYLNQYEVAGRILRARKIPAILFVTGELIDSKTPLVVDRLLHWTAYSPTVANKRERWICDIRPRYAGDLETKGAALLAKLEAEYPMEKIFQSLSSEYVRLRLTGVRTDQLDELKMCGWVIGYHTKSHYPLASLSREEKYAEIDAPDVFKNAPFSYPYGELKSVDCESVEVVRECGYPCAVSNTLERISASDIRYFLPRMALPADKYLLHFELSGLKHFIKTLRLLPRM